MLASPVRKKYRAAAVFFFAPWAISGPLFSLCVSVLMIVAGSSLLFASLSPFAAIQPRAVCRHAATAMNLIDGAVQLPVVADGVAAADGPALVQLMTAAAFLALVPARRLLQPQGLRDVYVRPGKGSHGVGLIAIRSVPKRAACAAAKTGGLLLAHSRRFI